MVARGDLVKLAGATRVVVRSPAAQTVSRAVAVAGALKEEIVGDAALSAIQPLHCLRALLECI